MKNLIVFMMCLLCTPQFIAQESMNVFLNDGTEINGTYQMRRPTFANSSSKMMLVSAKTDEKYTLDEFTKVVVSTDSGPIVYEVIEVKTNFDDKETEKKLGLVAYKGEKMELYYVEEIIHSGGTVGIPSISAMGEAYVKRSADKIAYNMGYIYGAGARGIKKRARDYFSDCPILLENIDNGNISKKKTLDIVQFYEANCGK